VSFGAGYGITPTTYSERLFLGFYLIIGVGYIGSVVGVIFGFILEYQQRVETIKAYSTVQRIKEGSKSRRPVVFSNSDGGSSAKAAENGLEEDLLGAGRSSSSVESTQPQKSVFNDAFQAATSFIRRGTSTTPFGLASKGDKVENIQATLSMVHEEEYKLLWRRLFINVSIITIIIVIGVVSMMSIEGWDGETAFYWAAQTITTVGYGDVSADTGKCTITSPISLLPLSASICFLESSYGVSVCLDSGIIFTIFYCIFGCGWMAKTLSELVASIVTYRLKTNELRVLGRFRANMSKGTLQKMLQSDFLDTIPGLVSAYMHETMIEQAHATGSPAVDCDTIRRHRYVSLATYCNASVEERRAQDDQGRVPTDGAPFNRQDRGEGLLAPVQRLRFAGYIGRRRDQ
jgi:Ion channel